MDQIDRKYRALKEHLAGYDSLIVAFSGGIDSALLLKVAYEVLGDRVLAVTSDSPSIPRHELEEAKRIAADIGAPLLIVNTNEAENESYIENPANRCYYCKSELYGKLADIARQRGIQYIASGTNYDDLGDYRPGLQAADENKIKSPLKDAGFSKNDIRELARRLGMDVWDKPAAPCLASRIPYGSKVTPEKLTQVEKSENILRGYGIRELRVRHFGDKARIEANKDDLSIVSEHLDEIEKRFRTIGFDRIELKEFKSGALNAFIHVQG